MNLKLTQTLRIKLRCHHITTSHCPLSGVLTNRQKPIFTNLWPCRRQARNLCGGDVVCVFMGVCECVCLWRLACTKRYLKTAMTDIFHILDIDLPCWEKEAYCLWWRSKVIWGLKGSKSENLVNTISQDSDDRYFSYLVYRFVMPRKSSLIVFGRDQRSSEVAGG